jgi:alkylhydroperoxidase family enzyme
MCGVAVLNGAEYELTQHAPLYQRAGGTGAQVEALRRLGDGAESDPAFDASQQAVLALVLEMTRQVHVSDATFARARAVMGSDARMFELIGVIAAYNMVSRILVAAQLEP